MCVYGAAQCDSKAVELYCRPSGHRYDHMYIRLGGTAAESCARLVRLMYIARRAQRRKAVRSRVSCHQGYACPRQDRVPRASQCSLLRHTRKIVCLRSHSLTPIHLTTPTRTSCTCTRAESPPLTSRRTFHFLNPFSPTSRLGHCTLSHAHPCEPLAPLTR